MKELEHLYKYLILFFLSLFFLSEAENPKQQVEYFEGELVYEIKYLPTDERFSNAQLQKYQGNRMVLTFKKGNYKKEYFSPDGDLIRAIYLDLKKHKSYLITPDSDTVHWFDISRPDSKTNFIRLEDQVVLNHSCNVIETETIVGGSSIGDETFKVVGRYYYSQELPVNSLWYSNYYEGNFNEIIKEAKGIDIKSIYEGLFWERQMVMQTKKERKVKKKEITPKFSSSVVFVEL